MSEKVNRGETKKLRRVDGDLKVGKNATIEALEGNSVVVTGDAYFDGAAELNCDFQCDSLRVGGGGVLKVRGNLTVLKKLDVVHSIEADGFVKAEDIDVGGKIYAKSIECKNMRSGGVVEAIESLIAENVNVGGKVLARRNVQITNLDVGGRADVGGGSITGNIRVGGRFEGRSKLEFGDLQVFGHTTFGDSCKGRRMSTFGKVSAASDLECEEIDIEGVTEIHGNCIAKKVEVNGKLDVHGSLISSESVEIYGTADVQRELKSASLRIGGKFRGCRISRAEISGDIDLAGAVETLKGLQGNFVVIRSGSRVSGPIVGNLVEVGKSGLVVANWNKKWAGQIAAIHMIGKMTRVEDVYGKEVHLGASSQSGKVYADVVEVSVGTMADEILYTTELRGPVEKSYFQHPPRKVSEVPVPPI